MTRYQTILHPTDFSKCADQAFELAVSLARDHQAKLVVVHVAPPPIGMRSAPVLQPPVGPPISIEWHRRDLESQLKERTAQGLMNDQVHRLIFGDSESDEIVRLANEFPCDLIVMGTHGRTGVGRLLIGSVAEQVVRKATCPVLTIKVPAGESTHSTGFDQVETAKTNAGPD